MVSVQVNGKMRGNIDVDKDAAEDDVMKLALENDNVSKHTDGKNVVKVIYRPGRILNIVVKG